jgi:hypothetical protein
VSISVLDVWIVIAEIFGHAQSAYRSYNLIIFLSVHAYDRHIVRGELFHFWSVIQQLRLLGSSKSIGNILVEGGDGWHGSGGGLNDHVEELVVVMGLGEAVGVVLMLVDFAEVSESIGYE